MRPAEASATELTERSIDGLSSLLLAVEQAPPGAVVDVLARSLLSFFGATHVAFLIADLSGESLFPVSRARVDDAAEMVGGDDPIPILDSTAGIALRRQRTQVVVRDETSWVHSPITVRGDALGVLEVRLPTPVGRRTTREIETYAHLLGYLVTANQRHTDLFEAGVRRRPMTLAGEIQRHLIAGPFVCEARQFTIAAWLEPSLDPAGDTFDYSFDENTLTCTLTDAMGHSVDAALLATLAVSALRKERRAGGGIVAAAVTANDSLLAHARGGYVTGLLVDIDLTNGDAVIVNAGHPLPFLVRGSVVRRIDLSVDLPFGIMEGEQYRAQHTQLLPGDRLILVTDGLLEQAAEAFDLQSFAVANRALHGREFVRALCRAASLEARGQLNDDATVLCIDWRGPV